VNPDLIPGLLLNAEAKTEIQVSVMRTSKNIQRFKTIINLWLSQPLSILKTRLLGEAQYRLAYTECQAFFAVVRIGSSHPLTRKGMLLLPPSDPRGGGATGRVWGDQIPSTEQTLC
jgi:hypothetical protein